MWSQERCKYVNGVVNHAMKNYYQGDSDYLFDAFSTVEDDTGYEIDFLYDIFVEILDDEREDNVDIETAMYRAIDYTITVAYEYDH